MAEATAPSNWDEVTKTETVWSQTGFQKLQCDYLQGKYCLRGHVFDCKHAKNYDKFDHSLQGYIDYITNELTISGSKVKYTIKQEQWYTCTDPVETEVTKENKSSILLYKHKMKQFIKNKADYDEHQNFVFGILWQQSSELMRSNIKMVLGWDTTCHHNYLVLIKK